MIQQFVMASSKRVAVVTGSNKGIGFAIVRALCKQFDGDVYLTARDEGRGREAVAELAKEGLKPQFHQLDITDAGSVTTLRDFLKDRYGGLDVLVNNAGIAYKADSTAPFSEQAEVTMNANFFATLDVCEKLFPLLKPHARVSNVASFTAQMAMKKCSSDVQKRINDPKLTMDGLKKLMTEFVSLAKEGKHEAAGWPNWSYAVTKIGVSMMSFLQQRQLDADKKDDIIVNACCPGYVNTDMTSHKGHKTIDQGAETPVMLALIPPNATSPRGEFLSDKKIVKWV